METPEIILICIGSACLLFVCLVGLVSHFRDHSE